MSNKLLLFVLMALLTLGLATASDTVDFKLADLEGDWEGVGTFVVPMTGMEMDIEGQAKFEYVHDKNYLRTELVGEKFLFTYSDSGHLAMDQRSDSLTWEVWDNLGRHAFYRGKKEGGRISGERMYKGDLYSVEIKLVTMDSLAFRLSTTDEDGDSADKATFNLWRVK